MKILVIGCAGQDGSYLIERLTEAGHAAYGINRSGLVDPDGQQVRECNIEIVADMAAVIGDILPERVFYLAAYHHSSEGMEAGKFSIIRPSFAVHVTGLINVLDSLVDICPQSRLFYAASSRVFGMPPTSPQNEDTPINPLCPYGITKATGVHITRLYRRHGFHCGNGFLYNHESPRRADHFVSRKIAKAVIAIERGQTDKLVLGDLAVTVDWGYAPEYVEAMDKILDLDEPADFIIASGRSHTIQDFAAAAFGHADLTWQDHVDVDPSVVRSTDQTVAMIGNASRLHTITGWRPETDLGGLARLMVDAERERAS
jgi:GDPmannose 4,6-dehydratase